MAAQRAPEDYSILTKEQVFTFTITALLLDITVPITIAVYKPYYTRAKEREALAANEVIKIEKVDCSNLVCLSLCRSSHCLPWFLVASLPAYRKNTKCAHYF